MRRFITATLALVWLLSGLPAAHADAQGDQCSMALATAAGQYSKRRVIAAARCRLTKGEACLAANVDKQLSGLETRLGAKLGEICSDADLAAMAPDGICPDPSGRCSLPVDSVASALACLTCLAAQGADALDRVMGPRPGHGGEFCGGCPGEDCGPDAFCQHEPGSCGNPFAPGACVPWDGDAVCSQEVAPVCGCDGTTYTNDCQRKLARTSKAYDGPCQSRPSSCSEQALCPDGQFCETQPGHCQKPDSDGKCVVPPQVCPQIFAPVCGCDGNTYANDCERLAASVGKDRDGECKPQALICGGIAGLPCPDGQLCVLAPGNCETADAQGLCLPAPEACPEIDVPVCGCDGQSYGNRCELIKAGIALAHRGPCKMMEPGGPGHGPH